MALSPDYLEDLESGLREIAPGLLALFQEAYARLRDDLSDEQLRDWTSAGRRLAELSPLIAGAYFKTSPDAIPLLPPGHAGKWAAMGQRLHKPNMQSIKLTEQFFNLSPALLGRLTLIQLDLLSQVIARVSERSTEQAAICVAACPKFVATLTEAERQAFLDLAAGFADAPWPQASAYFRQAPELLSGLHHAQRLDYLRLAAAVAGRHHHDAYVLFTDAATALGNVEVAHHGQLVYLAGRLLAPSAEAAMAFLKSSPVLLSRLSPKETAAWVEIGRELLTENPAAGEAYFRLESGRALQAIEVLSARADLSQVSDRLRRYCKALTGADISVQPLSALAGKGIGWLKEQDASTDGAAIYLPGFIDRFETKAQNLASYKVYATHQAAHIEFGSFEFSFRRGGRVLPRRRHLVERERRARGLATKKRWTSDTERFFDLFTERQLGADLFAIVEDLRIDSRLKSEYGGLRQSLNRAQALELEVRLNPASLPLREAFVENLVRSSLGGRNLRWPVSLAPLLAEALRVLDLMRSSQSSVEDAAEATLLLYDLAILVPNLPPAAVQQLDWMPLTSEELRKLAEQGVDIQAGLKNLPFASSVEYGRAARVDFHGDFKPELVRLLLRLRSQDREPPTPEEIKKMLEQTAELDPEKEDKSGLDNLVKNILDEARTDLDDADEPVTPLGTPFRPGVKTFQYDEWDFRAGDYRPQWCTVQERRIAEGSEDYYTWVSHEHGSLILEARRQFEMLKQETFRKLKRLEDGEDIDLDAAIDFVVQKKSGRGDVQKVYWRRNKIERDVAVAFLLDMSNSTDESVLDLQARRHGADPHEYAPQTYGSPSKRIIDVEKESLVVLTRALEVLGDRYGIYGFSSFGRQNVEFYVIKELEERFDNIVRRRIDMIEPIQSTRMGPAIRHTTAKLMQNEAKARVLFLISDGRPQDQGYGRDRNDADYAIQDTHRALMEAKYKGITPFALTVDLEGHDYLRQMCSDMAYEVLDNIEALPSRLPALYRRLTE